MTVSEIPSSDDLQPRPRSPVGRGPGAQTWAATRDTVRLVLAILDRYRWLPLLALGLGLVSILLPHSRDGALALVLGCTFAYSLSAALGFTSLRDDDTATFLLARPLAPGALLPGCLAAALVLSATSGMLALVPSMLTGRLALGGRELAWFAALLPAAFLLPRSFTVVRDTRTPWRLLHAPIALASGWWCLRLAQQVQPSENALRFLAWTVGAAMVVGCGLGSHLRTTLGRLEDRAGHRWFAVGLWLPVLAILIASQAWTSRLYHPDPQRLVVGRLTVAPGGGAFVASTLEAREGWAAHLRDAHRPLFVVIPEAGAEEHDATAHILPGSIRLDLLGPRQVVAFAPDGGSLYSLDPTRAEPSLMQMDLVSGAVSPAGQPPMDAAGRTADRWWVTPRRQAVAMWREVAGDTAAATIRLVELGGDGVVDDVRIGDLAGTVAGDLHWDDGVGMLVLVSGRGTLAALRVDDAAGELSVARRVRLDPHALAGGSPARLGPPQPSTRSDDVLVPVRWDGSSQAFWIGGGDGLRTLPLSADAIVDLFSLDAGRTLLDAVRWDDRILTLEEEGSAGTAHLVVRRQVDGGWTPEDDQLLSGSSLLHFSGWVGPRSLLAGFHGPVLHLGDRGTGAPVRVEALNDWAGDRGLLPDGWAHALRTTGLRAELEEPRGVVPVSYRGQTWDATDPAALRPLAPFASP